jgi:hypothetical protein
MGVVKKASCNESFKVTRHKSHNLLIKPMKTPTPQFVIIVLPLAI